MGVPRSGSDARQRAPGTSLSRDVKKKQSGISLFIDVLCFTWQPLLFFGIVHLGLCLVFLFWIL